jgi:hypothetical protein
LALEWLFWGRNRPDKGFYGRQGRSETVARNFGLLEIESRIMRVVLEAWDLLYNLTRIDVLLRFKGQMNWRLRYER